MRPHRWQPTRLRHPWDSPGKNTGVGCHFLLQCMKVKSLSRVQPSATPRTAAFQAHPSMGFSRQEYWSGVPFIKHFYTYTETKHHPRANKFQSKTYHANSSAIQENSPELQYTGCPKSHEPNDISKFIIGHFIALQREDIQLHPPEHRHKLP